VIVRPLGQDHEADLTLQRAADERFFGNAAGLVAGRDDEGDHRRPSLSKARCDTLARFVFRARWCPPWNSRQN
jgi:hypothetical protein